MSEINSLEEELNFSDKTFNDAQRLNKSILFNMVGPQSIGNEITSSRRILEIPENIDLLQKNPFTMKEENETVDYQKLVNKKKEIVSEVMKPSFVWTVTNEETIKRYFDSFTFLKSRWLLTFTLIRSQDADLCLDKQVCTKILSTPLLDMNNNTGLLTGIKGVSSFLGYFKSMYLKALLASKPKLESENFWLYDPVFRGLIRFGNISDQDVFRELISSTFEGHSIADQIQQVTTSSRSNAPTSAQTITRTDSLYERFRDVSVQTMKFSTYERFWAIFKNSHSMKAHSLYKYFWIKLIVKRCFEIFFPIVSWEHIGFVLKGPKTVLKMVLIMLETGFYSPDELPLLSSQILHASERITMLESQIVEINQSDPNAFSQAEWKSVCHESYSYRITIAKIAIQMLVLYLDSLTEESFHNFEGFQTQFLRNITKFFSSKSFYKQKYYKQKEIVKNALLPTLTKIFVNYLLKTTPMEEEYKSRANMRSRIPIDFYIQMFMSFIGDKKSDLFMSSLTVFLPENTLFYRNYYKFFASFEVKKGQAKAINNGSASLQTDKHHIQNLFGNKEKLDKTDNDDTNSVNMQTRADVQSKNEPKPNHQTILQQNSSKLKKYEKIAEYDKFASAQTIKLSEIISDMQKKYINDDCESLLFNDFLSRFHSVVNNFQNYLFANIAGKEKKIGVENNVLNVPFADVIFHRLTDDRSINEKFDFQHMYLPSDLQNVLIMKMFLNKLFLIMNVLTRMAIGSQEKEKAKVDQVKIAGIQRGFALAIAICRENCQAINAIFSVRNRKHLIFLLKFHKAAMIFSFYCIFKSRRSMYMLENNRLVSHFLFSIFDFEMQEFSTRFSTTNSEIVAKTIARNDQNPTLSISSSLVSTQPNIDEDTIQKRITLVCSLIFLSKIFKNLTQPTKFKPSNMSVIEKKADNANIFFDQKRGRLIVEFEMKLSNLLSKVLFPILESYMKNTKEFNIGFDLRKFLDPKSTFHQSKEATLGPWNFVIRYLVGLLYHSVKNFYDDGFFQPGHSFFNLDVMKEVKEVREVNEMNEVKKVQKVNMVVNFDQFSNNRDGRKTIAKLLSIYKCYQKVDHFMFRFDDKLIGSESKDDEETHRIKEEFSQRNSAFEVIMDNANANNINKYLGINKYDSRVDSRITGDPVLKNERIEALLDTLIPIIFDWLQQRKIDKKIENNTYLKSVEETLENFQKSYFTNDDVHNSENSDDRKKNLKALYRIFYSTIESEFDVTFTANEVCEFAGIDKNNSDFNDDSDPLLYVPKIENLSDFVRIIHKMTELASKNSLEIAQKEHYATVGKRGLKRSDDGRMYNSVENESSDNKTQLTLQESKRISENDRSKGIVNTVEKVNKCLKIIIDIYARNPEQIRNLTVHRILDRKDMIIGNKILSREKLSLENQFEVGPNSGMIKIYEDQVSVCYAHKHRTQHGFGIVAFKKDPNTDSLLTKLTDYELWSDGKYLRVNYLLQYKDFKTWICQTGADGIIFNQIIGYETEVNPSASNFVSGVFRTIERIRTDSPITVNIYTHYHMFYYLNRHFYVMLMLLGQLMKVNSQDNKIRELILEKINEQDGMVFLLNLWRLFKVFQSFMNKNNFYVKNYFTLYRPFYIIIDFFKNLCEDNFVGFKQLFNDMAERALEERLPSGYAKSDSISTSTDLSISEQVYKRMIDGIKKSDLDNPQKSYIDMFDKPAHFNLTNDILYMFIEFINGGLFLPEWAIKEPQKSPVWGNILYRIIDDVNDQFYDIKYNVIVYLAAIKESGNQRYIDFMKEYIFFDKVSELMSRLIAKLFVYCRKKNSNSRYVTEEQWMFLDPRLSGQQGKRQLVMDADDFRDEESLIGILNPKVNSENDASKSSEQADNERRRPNLRMGPYEFWLALYEFYLLYPNDFSSHKIMNTVIQLMIMLLELGDRLPDFEQKTRRYNQQVPRAIQSWTNSETTWETFKTSVDIKCRAIFENPNGDQPDNINQVIIWQFINLIIGLVEIVIVAETNEEEGAADDNAPTDQIVQHRFQLLPEYFFYNLELRTDFIKNADISNRESKLKTFFSDIPEKRLLLQAKLELYRLSRLVYYFTKPELIYFAIWLLFVIALAINILMLLYFNDASHDFDSSTNGNATPAVNGLAIFSLVLSALCLVLWLGFRTWFRVLFVRHMKKGKPYISNFLFGLKVIWEVFWDMLYTSEVRYLVVTIGSYALGLGQFYFFYTIPLFLVLYLSPLLSSILTSIFRNLLKLGYLIIIILSVTNIFAILIVQYFNGDFNTTNNVYESDTSICKNYRQCLINVFSMGLRWGNGIGDMLNYNNQLTSDQYFGLFFLEIIFFTIVNMLLLGAFFGIVVDTFKSYKEQLNKHAEMDTTVCFICGMNSTDFQRYGLNFEEHVQADHNPFSYFALHLMLSNKPEIDFSGREIYIWDKFNGEERNDVLPNNNCLKFLGRKLKASDKDDDN